MEWGMGNGAMGKRGKNWQGDGDWDGRGRFMCFVYIHDIIYILIISSTYSLGFLAASTNVNSSH